MGVSYVEFAPPSGLEQSVGCVWARRGGSGVRVMPDGCVDLVWHQGDGVVLAGPDTGPRTVDAEPGVATIGVRFLPGAGGGALGLPLSEVRDLQPRLEELWRLRAISSAMAPRDAIRALVILAAQLVDRGRPDPVVRRAAIRLGDPGTSVERLAAELGLGERQLRRRFDAAVGYGPKTLQRVLRFRRFVRLLDRSQAELDLAALAAETGYADQAHMTRESARLGGLSPAVLALTR